MKSVVVARRSEGVEGIKALKRAGIEVAAVFPIDENGADRAWYLSVTDHCRDNGIPLENPSDLNDVKVLDRMREIGPDFLFCFGLERLIMPQLLGIAKHGSFKLHLSLLPAYRGPNPVRWSIIRNERVTGVTLHHMVEQPDAGDVVGSREVTIEKEDTTLTLYNKLVKAGGELLDQTLPLLIEGRAPRTPLDISKGSYFGPWRDDHARIDWTMSSWEVYNLVRALTRPLGGAFSTFMGDTVRVWRATPDDSAPGLLQIGEFDTENDKLFVGCRYGQLRLDEIEWKGKLLDGPAIAQELGPLWRNRFR